MHLRALERMLEEQHEHDLRYGLEQDPRDELEREFELADRIAEHASMPPGDPGCRALARKRLGLPGSPYEHPHDPPPRRYAECVSPGWSTTTSDEVRDSTSDWNARALASIGGNVS